MAIVALSNTPENRVKMFVNSAFHITLLEDNDIEECKVEEVSFVITLNIFSFYSSNVVVMKVIVFFNYFFLNKISKNRAY